MHRSACVCFVLCVPAVYLKPSPMLLTSKTWVCVYSLCLCVAASEDDAADMAAVVAQKRRWSTESGDSSRAIKVPPKAPRRPSTFEAEGNGSATNVLNYKDSLLIMVKF